MVWNTWWRRFLSRTPRNDETESLREERGGAGGLPEAQEDELPLGPLRDGVVESQSAPQEDETVAADRAEAERRRGARRSS
jgi:hypothetical protein